MKLPSRFIDEYGVIHALDARGLYVRVPEPEPKVSGLWLYALAGIGMLGIAAIGWGLFA